MEKKKIPEGQSTNWGMRRGRNARRETRRFSKGGDDVWERNALLTTFRLTKKGGVWWVAYEISGGKRTVDGWTP